MGFHGHWVQIPFGLYQSQIKWGSIYRKILRPIVLPLINKHAGVVLEQDNVRSHVAQISRTFLQHAEVENLPRARVPDLNPI
jgi:hypothetical protein